MQFTKRLHDGIRNGEITTSIRIWQRPRVTTGGRYALGKQGRVEVIAIREIGLDDVTARMARDSGFAGIADLLKTARHGPGERVFFIEFRYIP